MEQFPPQMPLACRFVTRHVSTQGWIGDIETLEEVQVMGELPDALRREVSCAVNCKLFKKLGFLHDSPQSEQMSIAAMMTPLQVCSYFVKHLADNVGLQVLK